MKKILPLCFALSLVAAGSGCVGDREEAESTDADESAAQLIREEGKAAVQEDTEESSADDELVNFPKERIRKLVLVKELTRDHPDGPPFWPAYVQYMDGTLYVYDDNTHTVLQYDDEFKQKSRDYDVTIDSSDEYIFSMSVNNNGTIIISGSEYIHIVSNKYNKHKNVYGIKSLITIDNIIYAYNYERQIGTMEYAFITYDYNLRRLRAVAANPFVNELFNLAYTRYVGDSNCIYFTINSATRIARFDLSHGYPKAPVAVRTFSFEKEFKPYIDKMDEWVSQPPPPGRSPRRRQIVTGICLFESQPYIMMQWRKKIYIGEFDTNGKMKYIYCAQIAGGGSRDVAACKHKDTILFIMPVTKHRGGGVFIYKCELAQERR